MDKFVTNIKLGKTENLGENITNEQEIHQKELESHKIIQKYYLIKKIKLKLHLKFSRQALKLVKSVVVKLTFVLKM